MGAQKLQEIQPTWKSYLGISTKKMKEFQIILKSRLGMSTLKSYVQNLEEYQTV